MQSQWWGGAALLAGTIGLLGCGTDRGTGSGAAGPAQSPLFDSTAVMEPGLKKALLRQQIQAFAGQQGRNPESLEELGASGAFKVPEPPPGCRWDYQPEVGSVEPVAK